MKGCRTLLKVQFNVMAFLVLLCGICPAQVSEFKTTLKEFQDSWRDEQRAIKEIRKLGGYVILEDCVPKEWHDKIPASKRKFVVRVNMVFDDTDGGRGRENTIMSNQCLQWIGKCTQVRKIYLTGKQTSDKQLKHLARLKHVEVLMLFDAFDVTDNGLKHFERYRKLRHVHVTNSKITHEGLKRFYLSPQIIEMSLQGNVFENEVFSVCRHFKKLKSLAIGLIANKINDDGLREAAKLVTLEELVLSDIQATDQGAKELLKLPRLRDIFLNGPKLSEGVKQQLRDYAVTNRSPMKK